MSEQEVFELERELFHRACLLAQEERGEFLDDACRENPGLRERLEALLAAEGNPILDPLPVNGVGSVHVPEQTIEGYRLIRKIGDGGMGEVWEAEQEKPIQRRVALKLIRWGMDTDSVVRRFESERQALAMMDHPNIARVFDAGSTDQGRPYFAMELFEGVPITDYCDEHQLSVRERLQLFAQVCGGVQHAHQKGIIHRDIKPANILVTEFEGGALPKIIDFGIAKATKQRLTEASVFTELGQWVGTPEYMSPEQAAIQNEDIDTRTDVYSLGVVLYELLVGAQPLSQSELRALGFDEMRLKIRDEEPPRPSTRARSTSSGAESAARHRQTSTEGLARALEGDLDWLTMKALEKDRDRRYPSPVDLSADIDRFLRHEPVLAGPPGGIYRARKFVRRHRVGVIAASFCVAALVVGFGLAMVGFVRARASEQEAVAQAKAAQQVSGFLEEVFSVMDPGSQAGDSVSPRDVLQHGANRISNSLHGQPEARARLMATIGRVSTSLGYFDLAEPLLTDALAIQRQAPGNDHTAVANTLFTIGWMAFWQADFDRSHDAFTEASAILEKAPASDARLALSATTAAGFLKMRQGDIDGAREILDRALETAESTFGPEDPLISDILLFLGDLHIDLGQYEESGRALDRALRIRRESYGIDHQQYAFAMMSQSRYLRFTSRFDESENMIRQAIDIFERTYGPEHPAVANSLGMLGTTLRVQQKYEAAVTEYQRAMSILTAQFGPDNGGLTWIQRGLARTYLLMERLQEALETAREAFRVAELAYGPEHLESARGLALIAYIEYRLERYQESRTLYEQSLEIWRKTVGPDHPALATAYYNHSCVSALVGDHEGALDSLQRSLDAGFSNPVAFDDPDLDSLRGDPRFEEMLSELRSRQPD